MSGARVVVGVAVLGLAAFALVAYARSQSLQAPEDQGSIMGDLWGSVGAAGDPFVSAFDSLQAEVEAMNQNNALSGMSPDANVRAFLDVIQRCEGTAGQGDPYRVCYGFSHVIQDFSDHPKLTGEWAGVQLSDVQCGGAGLSPGCISTAAGAYQITRPTWQRLRDRLGLVDFSPASQDAAAIQLLKDCGAYSRLAAGDLSGAVAKARGTWASLPGANYAGQGMRTFDQVASWYSGSGGAVA
jgi:lysozyme